MGWRMKGGNWEGRGELARGKGEELSGESTHDPFSSSLSSIGVHTLGWKKPVQLK